MSRRGLLLVAVAASLVWLALHGWWQRRQRRQQARRELDRLYAQHHPQDHEKTQTPPARERGRGCGQ